MYKAGTLILISILPSVLLWQEKTLLGADEAEYPSRHLKYMKNVQRRWFCSVEDNCHNKPQQKASKRCWGYEKDCKKEYVFQYPNCDNPIDSSASLESKLEMFWNQGGFGYVKNLLDSIKVFCEPKEEGKFSFKYSELKCSENWQYCAARNIFIDLTDVKFSEDSRRYIGDFFTDNRIGGSCNLKKDLFEKPVEYNDELRSWNAELSHYTAFDYNPFNDGCDEIIEKPTFFMKLDSGFNMYHHFCDFLNLYISQHIYGKFSTDVYIVNWDTSTAPYRDLFSETWNVFSKYPIKRLNYFNGKKVCFKNAVFSLLPRMINGLYYNSVLLPDCHGGGLLKAFSEHVLHRLGIHQVNNKNGAVRVTLLKRSTKFRNILNRDELIAAMEVLDGVNLTVVDYKYKEMPFLEQLKIAHNSDIFIGVHGAGLTHTIFQPDWGVAFELYNMEDIKCYKDLTRLRGLYYLTWEDKELLFQQDKGHHPTLSEGHPKFTNYAFNVKEFIRLLMRAIKVVKLKRKPR